MLVRLDPRSDEPIYTQIVSQVKLLIAAGKLKPDDQLPTVRQLATDLRVNTNTIARAYTELAAQGILSTQQGRGTYVLAARAPADQRRSRRERLRLLVEALLAEVERLGYKPEEVEKLWSEQIAAWRRSLKKEA